MKRLKLQNSRQLFDEDRQLVLEFSNHQIRNSLYSFEDLDKEKVRRIGQLFNLLVTLLDNDFKSIKDVLLENSSFWVNLFLKNLKRL